MVRLAKLYRQTGAHLHLVPMVMIDTTQCYIVRILYIIVWHHCTLLASMYNKRHGTLHHMRDTCIHMYYLVRYY